MKLSTIFQQLVHGELSQLSFGAGQGKIGPDDYDMITNNVNLGLSALYKRFKIKEGRLILQLEPGKYIYRLHSDHALSSRVGKDKYILDSKGNPFTDDINKIEKLITVDGEELPLNNPNEFLSTFNINQTTLEFHKNMVDNQEKIPEWWRGDQIKVVYRAGYGAAICCPSHYEPEMVEVDLPDIYLEALLYFVASRIHNPIGLNQEFNQGVNYAAKYEQECIKLELLGLQMEDTAFSNRFDRNYWC